MACKRKFDKYQLLRTEVSGFYEHWSPEQKLWAAVLHRILYDFYFPPQPSYYSEYNLDSPYYNERYKKKIRARWINERKDVIESIFDDSMTPGSVAWICEYIFSDPANTLDAIRSKVRNSGLISLDPDQWLEINQHALNLLPLKRCQRSEGLDRRQQAEVQLKQFRRQDKIQPTKCA